jgi:hypothetical protein
VLSKNVATLSPSRFCSRKSARAQQKRRDLEPEPFLPKKKPLVLSKNVATLSLSRFCPRKKRSCSTKTPQP